MPATPSSSAPQKDEPVDQGSDSLVEDDRSRISWVSPVPFEMKRSRWSTFRSSPETGSPTKRKRTELLIATVLSFLLILMVGLISSEGCTRAKASTTGSANSTPAEKPEPASTPKIQDLEVRELHD